MRKWVVTGFLVAIPMAGWADPSLECSVTANSQVEIGACVGDMLTGAEQAMEIALGFAKSSAAELDEITQRDVTLPALEAAQAAWGGYRDAHCDHIGATYGGGSGTGIAINSCRVELTRDRTAALLALLN